MLAAKSLKLKFIGALVVCGMLTTLVTGLLEHPTTSIIGAKYYGYPLAWAAKTITAVTHLEIVFSSFILDVLFWIVVSCVSLIIMTKLTNWNR